MTRFGAPDALLPSEYVPVRGMSIPRAPVGAIAAVNVKLLAPFLLVQSLL